MTAVPALPPMPSKRPADFLTVRQVATSLRVSKMTVYRLIHGDELLAYRIGRSLRVDRADLDRFLAGHTGGTCGS